MATLLELLGIYLSKISVIYIVEFFWGGGEQACYLQKQTEHAIIFLSPTFVMPNVLSRTIWAKILPVNV